MNLSVKDVAGLLGVSEKSVYRWITERALPTHRVGGQFRFNRAEIVEWAAASRVNLTPRVLEEPEAAGALPGLAEALETGGVMYRISGDTRESVLAAVVDYLRLPDGTDRSLLLQMLVAREKLASTGIGDGIAIPHTRYPIVMHVDKPMVTLCFLERPIEFGAMDGKPVHALFTLVCPTVHAHLHLLSRLAFALRDEKFKALIQKQASRDEILAAVRPLSDAMDAARPAERPGRRKAPR
jgi:PTS system nitrogen regulatory IIA component